MEDNLKSPFHETLGSAESALRQFDGGQLAQYAALSRPDKLALLDEKGAIDIDREMELNMSLG